MERSPLGQAPFLGALGELKAGIVRKFLGELKLGFLLFGPQMRSDGYRMDIGWISDGWWIGIFVPDGPTVCFLSLASRARARFNRRLKEKKKRIYSNLSLNLNLNLNRSLNRYLNRSLGSSLPSSHAGRGRRILFRACAFTEEF